ncbi:hypothetical protein NL676_025215 [Syzygium grande]|nr:hypothetical protein NL676_025215 [Syzygium grande]
MQGVRAAGPRAAKDEEIVTSGDSFDCESLWALPCTLTRRFLGVNSARLTVGHTITLAEHHTTCQGDELFDPTRSSVMSTPLRATQAKLLGRDQVKPHRQPVA